jgi:hypothetical protein
MWSKDITKLNHVKVEEVRGYDATIDKERYVPPSPATVNNKEAFEGLGAKQNISFGWA